MKTLLVVLGGLQLCVVPPLFASDGAGAANLLRNPGFETGETVPEGWGTFPDRPREISYVWDEAKCRSGQRSARVEGSGSGFGMWQQVVDVEPGRVYVLKAYVAFQDITPPGQCCLQLVFRDSRNQVLKMVYWPGHTGTREFAVDFPAALKVRAPDRAARVEVNLFLRGRGKVWFDDVFFGPAPVGEIAGTVTCQSKPLAGALVYMWGAPWDKRYEAVTDGDGKYGLADVPVAFPRYVLLAGKTGYRTRPAGDVEVKAGACTTVNFDLEPGVDPDDLHVKFGTLSYHKFAPGPRIPDGATIPDDPSGYPEAVRPYLEPDQYIQSDHPDVIATANQIVETLPVEDRKDTRKVAWAIYEWVCKNIDHDGVFSVAGRGGLKQPFRDVTSGIWQTISGEGWCWGRSFLDWCYRPHELLKVRCGICAEHAWLVSAMLRSLNIPARAAIGSREFYAQSSKENGVWIHGGTTAGRTNYRQRGVLGPGFEGGPPETRFSALSRPILHEDWSAQSKGLWRERHPWSERYEGTPAGYTQAKADLATFGETGVAPRRRPPRLEPPPRRAGLEQRRALRQQREQQQEDLFTQRRPRWQPPGGFYEIQYSDVTINLFNIGPQRILDVRFPVVSLRNPDDETKAENAYWTNHPECVRRSWVEKITNPPAPGAERWFHMEFDLTSLSQLQR